MRMIAFALAAGAALLAAPALQARPVNGEQKLAEMLQGYEAGPPVNCISFTQTNDVRVIDKTALVYRSGRTLYVNRPRHPASLDSDDVLVTRTSGSQLCRLDTVQLHDRAGLWFSGFVGLEQFVPYRKIARN